MHLCLFVQDVEVDSQSQSSFERTLSERGHSQMSTASDETWKGKSHTSMYYQNANVKVIVLLYGV